jgi:hypothetical protein
MVDKSALAAALEETLKQDKEAVWTQADAIDLCVLIEGIAPYYGAHVALTGGSLYKPGLRKDADILFYRIRQVNEINEFGLLVALTGTLGIAIGERYGWVVKAQYQGKNIDLFFPETKSRENAKNTGKYAEARTDAARDKTVYNAIRDDMVLAAGWSGNQCYNCGYTYNTAAPHDCFQS